MKNISDIGRRIILADGTVFEGSEAGYADGVLWCYIKSGSMTFPEIATVFSDEEKTKKIRYEYGEMNDEYKKFVVIYTILVREYGYDVALRKR